MAKDLIRFAAVLVVVWTQTLNAQVPTSAVLPRP